MSTIALFDSNSGKFSFPMKEHWEKEGHEVKYEYGYNPVLANDSDATFIDVCDGNAIVATTGGDQGESWIYRGNKLVVRAIDIDVWAGHYQSVDWSKVSDVIFIAKHIKELAEKAIDFESFGTRVHLIPCGVDGNKFTLKRDLKPNKKIAMVAELWYAKGIDMALEFATLLPEGYELHILGKWCLDGWHASWVNYFVSQHHLESKVKFIDYVEDMNEWLEDKTYAITFSRKEAFSYAIAEGMAKGLIPLIHDFQGARDIWQRKFIFSNCAEALRIMRSYHYPDPSYRNWVLERYSLDKMMDRINNEVLKLGA
jgi:glycosyltransferase involved in cell wall biosynthesis